MYQDHVPLIATAMRACPETFADGVMFAVISARTQFITVPRNMAELKKRKRAASCLWSWKVEAYEYLQDHKAALHRAVIKLDCPEAALKALCQIPGLGIIKAAFVLQMMGHDVACLDIRNIQREGRNPRAFRTDGKKTGAAFERKVARYVSETRGRAQELWDTWCADVAQTYGQTPDIISEMHTCFIPKGLRKLQRMSVPIRNEIPF